MQISAFSPYTPQPSTLDSLSRQGTGDFAQSASGTSNTNANSNGYEANGREERANEAKDKPQNLQSTADRIAQQGVNKSSFDDALEVSQSSLQDSLPEHFGRITYGLALIEQMSDNEYRAFLRATEGLSDSEKITMAQSLYRFTDLYQGREESINQDPILQEKYKAFGVSDKEITSFLNRYKNAYMEIASQNISQSNVAMLN
ncbi:hypothetical protein ACWIWK_03690 [Helicobacter sp. 23-1048]